MAITQLDTPEAISEWLAGQRTAGEKDAAFYRLTVRHGYQATVAIWHEAMQLHRRARSMCRAAREAWAIALLPDDDGKIPCPGCGDRVATTIDPARSEVRVIDAHRLATSPPVCGVDYEHLLRFCEQLDGGDHLLECSECGAQVTRAADGTIHPADTADAR
jgi:endogenous inhibitor of DNA gyrase (YacG/DUF329 family)